MSQTVVLNESLPQSVVAALKQRGETVATAESLTAGLLAATVADVPGASAVLRGGLVVYATDLKAALAGVPEDLLNERGPVDRKVAEYLARGARERCGATWGLATTGVAGPDPQDGKPVGLVYIGLAYGSADKPPRSLYIRRQFTGNRADIRRASVAAALALLLDSLKQD